jgi:hypothetical protein
MDILITQFSTATCKFSALTSQQSPQHPQLHDLRVARLTSPAQKEEALYVLNFIFSDGTRDDKTFYTHWHKVLLQFNYDITSLRNNYDVIRFQTLYFNITIFSEDCLSAFIR